MESYKMSIDHSGKSPSQKKDLVYWIALILIFISIFIANRVLETTPLNSKQKQLSAIRSQINLDLPESINGWEGIDIPLGMPELDLIQPDDYIFRNYSKHDKQVNVYIGYYDNQTKADLAHSPLVCYTGGGWNVTPRDDLEISMHENKEYQLQSIIVTKSEKSDLVFYGFSSPDFTTSNRLLLKFRLLIRSFSGASTQNAFVRYSTNLETNALDSKKTLEEFIDMINPYLDNILSDPIQMNLNDDQV